MGFSNPFLANAISGYAAQQQQQANQQAAEQRSLAMLAAKQNLDLEYQGKMMTLAEEHKRGLEQEQLGHQAVSNVEQGKAFESWGAKHPDENWNDVADYYKNLGTSQPDQTIVGSILRRKEAATSPTELRLKKQEGDEQNLNAAGLELYQGFNAENLQDPQKQLEAEQTLAKKYKLSMAGRKSLREDIQHIASVKDMPDTLKPIAERHIKDATGLQQQVVKGTIQDFIKDPNSEAFFTQYNSDADALEANWKKRNPGKKSPYQKIEVTPAKNGKGMLGKLGLGGTPAQMKTAQQPTVTLADLPATPETQKRYSELKSQGKSNDEIAQIISQELQGK